jgi:hypothetical protein
MSEETDPEELEFENEKEPFYDKDGNFKLNLTIKKSQLRKWISYYCWITIQVNKGNKIPASVLKKFMLLMTYSHELKIEMDVQNALTLLTEIDPILSDINDKSNNKDGMNYIFKCKGKLKDFDIRKEVVVPDWFFRLKYKNKASLPQAYRPILTALKPRGFKSEYTTTSMLFMVVYELVMFKNKEAKKASITGQKDYLSVTVAAKHIMKHINKYLNEVGVSEKSYKPYKRMVLTGIVLYVMGYRPSNYLKENKKSGDITKKNLTAPYLFQWTRKVLERKK